MTGTTHPLPERTAVRPVAQAVAVAPGAASVATAVRADHGAEPLGLVKQVWVWGSSLTFHLLILVILSLIYMTVEMQRPALEVDAEMTDQELIELLPDLVQGEDNWDVNPDVPISLMPAMTVTETMKSQEARKNPLDDMAIDKSPVNQLAYTEQSVELDQNVGGIQGSVVNTSGDVGSVDRITMEILRELKSSKVQVVWLMDASESLSARRGQVIRRFDRIYQELNELSKDQPKDQPDALLTSVIAFGKEVKMMTPEPTADPEVIRTAVREIPVDETGIENVFNAVKLVAMAYRKQIQKKYKIMLVILTDETGNDLDALDDAITQVKRSKIPVYVMGPLAPFSRVEINVPWIDEKTREEFLLPVERGPEAPMIEYPTDLPSWEPPPRNSPISSGFGPYSLARLTAESGGIYFLYDDGNIRGPKFDVTSMLDRNPEYVTPSEYQRLVEKYPTRKAVLGTTMVTAKAKLGQPTVKFLESGIQFGIREQQKPLQKMDEFFGMALKHLLGAETFREQEPSKRWQAHYDLLVGQLCVRHIRLNSTLPLLDSMFKKPKACKDGTTNAWEFAGVPGTALADLFKAAQAEEIRNSKGKSGSAKKDDSAKGATWGQGSSLKSSQEAKMAFFYLDRVVREHPGTPWAAMAEAELTSPLEFKWQEAFMIPPEGEKLPWDKKPVEQLTPKQKKAKEKFERFQREKKKKEEQMKKQGVTPEEVKKRIPKL